MTTTASITLQSCQKNESGSLSIGVRGPELTLTSFNDHYVTLSIGESVATVACDELHRAAQFFDKSK